VDHVAIMKRQWELTDKILDGRKKAESRWMRSKKTPFGKVSPGDRVFLKDSGRKVRGMALVKDVRQFTDLNPLKVNSLLEKHHKELGMEKEDVPKFFRRFKDAKYCVMMKLEAAKRLRPFRIDKSGFGSMSAWITIKDIEEIRIGG
jgi:hypothetical protein